MADERLRQRKDKFDAAHQQGMDGLATGDHVAVAEAICRERELIGALAAIIAERQDAMPHLRLMPTRIHGAGDK